MCCYVLIIIYIIVVTSGLTDEYCKSASGSHSSTTVRSKTLHWTMTMVKFRPFFPLINRNFKFLCDPFCDSNFDGNLLSGISTGSES